MDPANYVLARQFAGVLFFLDLLLYLPYANVCLGAGYWGGGHKHVLRVVAPIWAAASIALVLGVYPLIAAGVLWLVFRHYYVANRWNNAFRGGGAPGFMSHWVAMYLVLFELARVLDTSGGLVHWVRLMSNVDFGVILLCSGTYKALSGYLRGEGMEYGLANPFWGYWFGWFKRRRPSHLGFRLQNIWAPIAQISTGVCLLLGASTTWFPEIRWAGAVLCILSFGYLLPTVRLGRLAVLMMVPALWFLPELGVALPEPLARSLPASVVPDVVITILVGTIIAYIAVLPVLKVMQYLNLFAKIELPGPLQKGLTWYANKVPIIMWRVFTPDVTNFFVRIHRVDRATGAKTPLVHEDTTYSYRDLRQWRRSLRYLHVTESIALTTVFTTLKYFRSQRALFEERLRAYAPTLGEPGALLEFEYVAILKGEETFEFLPVTRFTIDLVSNEITEDRLVPEFEYDAPAKYSHIKETAGYGTYAPRDPASAAAR
ncbi:MAG: uncharacterized protein JWP01_2323 [Myxococcales bacterium]|nr:uncharacterized protein [Myxococcales bacterium]